MMLMRAGMKEYVSKMCNNLKPAKDTSKEIMAMMTIPTLGVILPDDIADRHCPPTTQMMALNPVNVARLSKTGTVMR